MPATLEADRARIATLDAQIFDLERSLLSLRNERQTVQARLDAHFYPVLTLPDEIVSEIFRGTLPEYPLSPPIYGLLSPTSLSQICHQWREIALSTPMLWRAMSFTVPEGISLEANVLPRRILHLLDVLKTGLSRSGSCPLSIQLDHPTQKTPLSPFLQVLLPHFTRVEHLQISHTLDPAEDPFGGIELALPLLRSLKFRCYFRNGVSSPITAFLQAPRLHTVILTDMRSQKIVLPWGQLTTLVLESIYSPECVAILEHAVSLVHCRIVVANRSVRPGGLTPTRPLAHLESLELVPLFAYMPHDAVAPVLNALTLPALRKLKIQEDHKAGFIDVIAAFLSRSGCILETLHIVQTEDWRQLTTPQHVYLAAFPFIPKLLVTAEEQKRG
ncbi:hypothetical protein C8R44DRAFT_797078 [Mycena epipterygia]|nr:hypothetical protein C8R44DRAFT_797078 [Mycena epipterygia]